MPVFFLIYYQHVCCKNTPYKMIETLRVQVSIYLSVSAFHLVFITLKMGGVAVGIQRKDLLGIPQGIPFDKARSALWRGVLPFSAVFHLIYSQIGIAAGIQRRGGWLLL